MGLTNRQYDMLRYNYDTRRRQARFGADRRTDEIYDKIPEIKAIDDRIRTDSIRRARLAISGDKSALEGLDESNAALTLQKEALLESHGFPKDYMQPRYECPVCQDTGYVNGSPCDCYKRALTELVYNDSNLAGILKEQNFGNFNYDLFSDSPETIDKTTDMTPRRNIETVVAQARHFIEVFDEQFNNLLIYGNTGVGKTFLCSCIAKELLDTSHSVVYYTAYKFFRLLENDKFHSADIEEDVPGPDYLIDCDLLILDDLGTELTNSYIGSALYSVLNERALKKHSTVISTNLSLHDLNTRYSERVFSRLNKDYTFLKITGEDIRCL